MSFCRSLRKREGWPANFKLQAVIQVSNVFWSPSYIGGLLTSGSFGSFLAWTHRLRFSERRVSTCPSASSIRFISQRMFPFSWVVWCSKSSRRAVGSVGRTSVMNASSVGPDMASA